jgi:hypothetical protein
MRYQHPTSQHQHVPLRERLGRLCRGARGGLRTPRCWSLPHWSWSSPSWPCTSWAGRGGRWPTWRCSASCCSPRRRCSAGAVGSAGCSAVRAASLAGALAGRVVGPSSVVAVPGDRAVGACCVRSVAALVAPRGVDRPLAVRAAEVSPGCSVAAAAGLAVGRPARLVVDRRAVAVGDCSAGSVAVAAPQARQGRTAPAQQDGGVVSSVDLAGPATPTAPAGQRPTAGHRLAGVGSSDASVASGARPAGRPRAGRPGRVVAVLPPGCSPAGARAVPPTRDRAVVAAGWPVRSVTPAAPRRSRQPRRRHHHRQRKPARSARQ